MITNKELNTVKLSPTKKDFYQIWNELLDTAQKISERWDPTSTNESDPGIILLKVLTAIADKLNYNIDANTLEAFMPSAAQEDSMRKLTEMLGYNMKYYQSATTEVKISYTKNISTPIKDILVIDKFTNIKDIDDSINYITLNALNLNKDNSAGNVICMEGELVECETDNNNIVSIFHLDDNYRYFLPETQIAENGIFITNIISSVEGEEWVKVDNLNSQALGAKVFKFGFDSFEGLPYVQFPEDISTIIEDGLKIKYVRTTGLAGNISAGTLTKLTTPISWNTNTSEEKPAYYDINNYTVSNIRAATNGTDKEGINSAYNNFKKTIGTFDTLVTCRDYMNRIYQMISDTDKTTPLVSNVIVSDIRDDINRAVTLGTFTHRGIEYKAIAKPYTDTDGTTKTKLTHFDLMLYPFTPVYGLNSKAEFIKSFQYNEINIPEIISNLEENKTLAHNIVSPNEDEIACIKIYYRLRAKVNTIRKVGTIEQANILSNIYIKLFENFNMRKMEFGEEIPYDILLQVMETADPRIKNISLDEPELIFKICTASGVEHELTSDSTNKAAQLYNKLVLNNVLAGRVPLFNYNESFKPDYTEAAYPSYESTYPDSNEAESQIYKLKTAFDIPVEAINGADNLKLMKNEVIQFRAPNLKTTITYPAYVYYYLHLDSVEDQKQAIPVTMQTLADFLRGGPESDTKDAKTALNYYANTTNCPIIELPEDEIVRETPSAFQKRFSEIEQDSVAIFTKDGEDKYTKETAESAWGKVKSDNTIKFYTFAFNQDPLEDNGVPAWRTWLINLSEAYYDSADNDKGESTHKSNPGLKGLYTQLSPDFTKPYGYLTEIDGTRYKLLEVAKTITANPFNYYFVPRIWFEEKLNETSSTTVAAADWHTQNGLGQDAIYASLTKDCEYRLKEDEYLLIYYKKSAEGDSEQKISVSEVHREGEIIKPNFALEDSKNWRNSGHSWTTTSGYDFSNTGKSNPEGMFALGTNEQIEVREIVEVRLNDGLTNLYWELNNEKTEADGKLVLFPWDEEPIYYTDNTYESEASSKTDYPKYMAYTLKEGEYLYYTDMNKTDIAFYGSGTTIRRTSTTPTIFKYITDDTISADEISEAGLNAAIPWRGYSFNDINGLTLMENQYINLTEGDTLCTIKMNEEADSMITADYKSVSDATYRLAASDEAILALPNLSLGLDSTWKVRSKLELNMSSSKTQTLHCYNLNETLIKDQLTLINSTKNNDNTWTDKEIITLEASDIDNPLSIKANKAIQSSSIITDVVTYVKSEEGITEEIIADLRLKLFKKSDLTFNSTNSYVNLNNFGDGTFTAINFKDILKNLPLIDGAVPTEINTDLNILLPEDSFGLMMIYYEDLREDKTIDITTQATITSTKDTLSKFNSDTSASNSIILTSGINIIKINSSDTITINSGSNIEASIIFSSLDIVYEEDTTNNKTSLNPKLCYKATSEAKTAYEQILADIKAIDTDNEFYYNIPIAGNLDIDMNLNDSKDTLENPLNWFSYNNINNKFVIAEIEADRLIDNIIIAKSSRSNY